MKKNFMRKSIDKYMSRFRWKETISRRQFMENA